DRVQAGFGNHVIGRKETAVRVAVRTQVRSERVVKTIARNDVAVRIDTLPARVLGATCPGDCGNGPIEKSSRGEITRSIRVCRNGVQSGTGRGVLAVLFKVEEKESLVMTVVQLWNFDWAAESDAVVRPANPVSNMFSAQADLLAETIETTHVAFLAVGGA